jgi:hypothetical protein
MQLEGSQLRFVDEVQTSLQRHDARLQDINQKVSIYFLITMSYLTFVDLGQSGVGLRGVRGSQKYM